MSKKATVGERLRELMEYKNLTIYDIAEAVSMSGATVSRYINDINKPKDVTIEKISREYGVNPTWLMGYDVKREFTVELEPIFDAKYIEIPVFGDIACGEPIEAFNEIEDYATIPTDWTKGGKEYFCLTAKGDSMEPEISSGDIAVIRKQCTCENGKIAAVFVNGYNATLKKFYKHGDVITLQPLNPNMEPRFYTKDDEEIQVLGVMVELRKKYD